MTMLNAFDTKALSSLTHAELIVTMDTAVDLLAGHPAFQGTVPDVVPGPDELRNLNNNFKETVNAAANGDRVRIDERKAKRKDLELKATLTAQYIVMKAIKENDARYLENTGLPLKNASKRGRNSRVQFVGTPSQLKLKHGRVSGTILLQVKREAGVVTIEVESCEGVPSEQNPWQSLGQHLRARMEIKNLTPATRYNFRARYHGDDGPGPWSQPAEIIVL